MRMLKSFMQDRSGATAIEYGLIAALIAIGLLAGLTAFSDALLATLTLISDTIMGVG